MFLFFSNTISSLPMETTPIAFYIENGGGYIFYKFLITLSFL